MRHGQNNLFAHFQQFLILLVDTLKAQSYFLFPDNVTPYNKEGKNQQHGSRCGDKGEQTVRQFLCFHNPGLTLAESALGLLVKGSDKSMQPPVQFPILSSQAINVAVYPPVTLSLHRNQLVVPGLHPLRTGRHPHGFRSSEPSGYAFLLTDHSTGLPCLPNDSGEAVGKQTIHLFPTSDCLHDTQQMCLLVFQQSAEGIYTGRMHERRTDGFHSAQQTVSTDPPLMIYPVVGLIPNDDRLAPCRQIRNISVCRIYRTAYTAYLKALCLYLFGQPTLMQKNAPHESDDQHRYEIAEKYLMLDGHVFLFFNMVIKYK